MFFHFAKVSRNVLLKQELHKYENKKMLILTGLEIFLTLPKSSERHSNEFPSKYP